MRYLLFGASSAIGITDYENGGWSAHLRKYLDMKEKKRHFHNLAISGDNTKKILNRMSSESKERIRDKPKQEWTIFISVGANDSRLDDGIPNTSEEDFKKNVQDIINTAKELAGTVIIVGSQPVIDRMYNPPNKNVVFTNDRIKSYCEIAKECATNSNVPFIEIFSKLIKMENFENLTDDGLHPNKEGHLIIYNIIKEFLENK